MARTPVQLDPDPGQHGMGLTHGHGVDIVGQGGDGQHHGVHGGDVAQASVSLLEVGLEEEGHVAVVAVALGHQVAQHPEPGRLLLGPLLPGPLDDGLGHLGVAADDPGVE